MMDGLLSRYLEKLHGGASTPHSQMISKVRVSLLEHESPAKWLFQAILMTSSESKLAQIKHDLSCFVQLDLENNADVRNCPLLAVAKFLLLAQTYIFEKNEDQAQIVISKGYRFVKFCGNNRCLLPDYMDGVRYLLRAVDISCAIECQEDRLEEDEPRTFLTDLLSLTDLDTKSLVSVLACQQYFLSLLGPNFAQQALEIAKKITELDPERGEWYYCVYLHTRTLRKLIDTSGTVSKGEQDAIVASLRCSDAKFNAIIWIEYLLCLSEVLRDLSVTKRKTLRFGERHFATEFELADFVRRVADDTIAMDTTSEKANITVAKVFGEILPLKFQDKSFGKACLKRALLFNPDSSNVLVELAMFYLQQGFFEKAQKRLSQAADKDKRNFGVILVYLKVLMRNMLHNYEKLKDLFEMIENNDENYTDLTEKLAEYTMTKAIYKFLVGREEEFMELLLAAVSYPNSLDLFLKTAEDINRYGWDRNMPGRNVMEEVYKTVMKSTYDASTKARSKCLEVIWDVLSRKSTERSEASGGDSSVGRAPEAPNIAREQSGGACGTPRGRGFTGRGSSSSRGGRFDGATNSTRGQNRGRGGRGNPRAGKTLEESVSLAPCGGSDVQSISSRGQSQGRRGAGRGRGRGNNRGRGGPNSGSRDEAGSSSRGGRGQNRGTGNRGRERGSSASLGELLAEIGNQSFRGGARDSSRPVVTSACPKESKEK